MKKEHLLSVNLLSILFFSACSANEEPTPNFGAENDENEPFELIIKYDGKTYSEQAHLENDSLVFLDSEFGNFYNSVIKAAPNMAVLTYKDNLDRDVVEYYNNEEQLLKESGLSFFDQTAQDQAQFESRGGESKPVASGTVGRACLYDDKTFKDRDITLDITQTLMWTIPDLKVFDNFNDKTSSIRVFNFLQPYQLYSPCNPNKLLDPTFYSEYGYTLRTCLIGYEDTNYGGKKLFCVSREAKAIDLSLSLEEMKQVYHCDWRLSKIGWNDKISSLVFRIVRVEDVNGTIIVPHPSF